MPYTALEWDHQIGKPMISWIVVECSRVERKFGLPQAMPPRRDVAYFVRPETAQADAQAFADFKNRIQAGPPGPEDEEVMLGAAKNATPERHAAFPWDHQLLNPLIQWAVLEWPGAHAPPSTREDIAYFLDPQTAERDAKAFGLMRDRRITK